MVGHNNSIRSNLGVVGYEQFNVRTGLSHTVPSSAAAAAEGGVAAPAEKFTPGNEGLDAAELMLTRWTQSETTTANLGSSAQIAREVGFEPPQASAQADPGNINYLAGGSLSFEEGGIGQNLLNGSGNPVPERAPQAQHDGWLIS